MSKLNIPSQIATKKLYISEALGCFAFVFTAQTINHQWLFKDGFLAKISKLIIDFNPYLNDRLISSAQNPEKYITTHTLSIIFAPLFLFVFLKNNQAPQITPAWKRVAAVIFVSVIISMPLLIDPTRGRRLSRIIFNDGMVGVFFGMAISMLIAATIAGVVSILIELHKPKERHNELR